jgi:drug/metabolite transporter (DMT)-like permease
VLSRRLGDTPTSSVAVFCVITAIASWGLHFALEDTVWPQSTIGWLSVAALGLGPVGLAVYVWDIGIKRGDIQLLGTSSYAAPILSTAVLVLTGIAEPTWALAIAAALVTGGALIAARASLSA